MANEKDYSEYALNSYEQYYAARKNNSYIALDYFDNQVRFQMSRRKIHITVDRSKEAFSLKEELEVSEQSDKTRGLTTMYDLPADEKAEFDALDTERVEKNNQDLARFCAQFQIDRTFWDDVSDVNPEQDIVKKTPLSNVLSGAEITLPLGVGVLDFVYADFKPAFQKAFSVVGAFKSLAKPERAKQQDNHSPTWATEKIHALDQKIIEDYLKYDSTRLLAEPITDCSLYTAICPPFWPSEHTERGLKSYFRYINTLQKEYLALLEFCFDQDFWPSVLGNLCPSERYYLYRSTHGEPYWSERKEYCSANANRMTGRKMPYGLSVEAMLNRLNSPIDASEQHRAFAAQYGLEPERLMEQIKMPHFLNVCYVFHSAADMLELEFTKLLESDVRFRKCQRCGKYFILKGNYDTRYCDRILPGETRTCGSLAAQENYAAKTAENKIVKLYRTYYKRYSARVKVNQLKPDEFKKWKYEAVVKRDQCGDGEISPDEFEAWLEASFPNRKKKDTSK